MVSHHFPFVCVVQIAPKMFQTHARSEFIRLNPPEISMSAHYHVKHERGALFPNSYPHTSLHQPYVCWLTSKNDKVRGYRNSSSNMFLAPRDRFHQRYPALELDLSDRLYLSRYPSKRNVCHYRDGRKVAPTLSLTTTSFTLPVSKFVNLPLSLLSRLSSPYLLEHTQSISRFGTSSLFPYTTLNSDSVSSLLIKLTIITRPALAR